MSSTAVGTDDIDVANEANPTKRFGSLQLRLSSSQEDQERLVENDQLDQITNAVPTDHSPVAKSRYLRTLSFHADRSFQMVVGQDLDQRHFLLRVTVCTLSSTTPELLLAPRRICPSNLETPCTRSL